MRKSLAALALMAVLALGVAHAEAQVNCCPSTTAPAPAAAAGYNTETFAVDGFSTSNVDMGKTYASGYKLYPFNFYGAKPTIANVKINSDTSISVGQGAVSYAGTLLSVGYKAGAAGYVGTAFGGGAYIQGVIKFNAKSLPSAAEWPAFWTAALEGIIQTSQWPGQATGYTHSIEADIMEYFEGDFSQPLNNYASNLHDWYGPQASLQNYDVYFTKTEPQIDFDSYHTYAMLWVPATATAKGTLTFYFDGAQIGQQSYSQFTTQSPPPGVGAPWSFGVIDGQHLVIEVDSNNTYPITVQSMDVWQTDATHNLHN
jgi:hypothetical protein